MACYSAERLTRIWRLLQAPFSAVAARPLILASGFLIVALFLHAAWLNFFWLSQKIVLRYLYSACNSRLSLTAGCSMI
jgi:hypothetical protein